MIIRMKLVFLLGIFCFIIGCTGKAPSEGKVNIEEVVVDGIKFPSPIFSGNPDELLRKVKETYKAERALIGRPIRFQSSEENDYWLKIEFLNPEIGDKNFKTFAREVATVLLDNLDNAEDFEKIEVSIVTKKGFIITFTTQNNMFFYIDSLSQIVRH